MIATRDTRVVIQPFALKIAGRSGNEFMLADSLVPRLTQKVSLGTCMFSSKISDFCSNAISCLGLVSTVTYFTWKQYSTKARP